MRGKLFASYVACGKKRTSKKWRLNSVYLAMKIRKYVLAFRSRVKAIISTTRSMSIVSTVSTANTISTTSTEGNTNINTKISSK